MVHIRKTSTAVADECERYIIAWINFRYIKRNAISFNLYIWEKKKSSVEPPYLINLYWHLVSIHHNRNSYLVQLSNIEFIISSSFPHKISRNFWHLWFIRSDIYSFQFEAGDIEDLIFSAHEDRIKTILSCSLITRNGR